MSTREQPESTERTRLDPADAIDPEAFKEARCLEFTLEVPKHFKGVSFIAVKLQGDGPRCSLTFSQTLAGPDADPSGAGCCRGSSENLREYRLGAITATRSNASE